MPEPPPTHKRFFNPTYLRLLCLYVRRYGVEPAEALAESGMSWTQLLQEERLLPFGPASTIVLACQRLSQRPWIGLEFGATLEVASHGVFGAALAASPTLLHALEAGTKYRRFGGRTLDFELRTFPTHASLLMHELLDLGDIRAYQLEAHATYMQRALETVVGEPLADIEYHFPYPAPRWAREYARYLVGTVHFGAAKIEIRVPRRLLSLPNVMANRHARAAMEVMIQRELLLRPGDGEVVKQIRMRLLDHKDSFPSAEMMAGELNMSPRTFFRRLSDEGVSYQQILDDAAKEVAEWYLLNTREPIERIGEKLGYDNAANFNRAFRRWFGIPPGVFRKRGRSASGKRAARRRTKNKPSP